MYQRLEGQQAHHGDHDVSNRYNYLGVGIARASDGTTWASIVFTESVDHTRPAVYNGALTRSGTTVRFAWSGSDPVLQTHTAGLRGFDVQYRVDGGAWRQIRTRTTARALSLPGRAHRPLRRASGSGPWIGAVTSRRGRRRSGSGCPDRSRSRSARPKAPLRRGQPDQRPDPRVRRADQAPRPGRGAGRGLREEDVAEDDLLDTAWVQRLRRISQLQSARWVFPTAEHSRFTHGLGVMHEAGLWARSLYPSLAAVAAVARAGRALPSEGLVVETLRVAGLLHDVGHGPFAHFFDDRYLAGFPAPADIRRPGAKSLSHEDLSPADRRARAWPADRRPAAGAGVRAGARRASPTASRSTRAGCRS